VNTNRPLEAPAASPARPALRVLVPLIALWASASPLESQSAPRLLSESQLPRFEYLSRLAASLEIPVEGVSADRLRDSFVEGRSDGRTHQAIDIHAPKGTPVLAVTDGTILKLYGKGKGGNSIFHLDPDGRTRYYYAHLDRYVDGLREGTRVRRGQVIGYVGDTGNARKGDYHLHFSIAILGDRSRWWEGENVNPYPVLKGLVGSR
jgi:peptidoglycan LD-endopeptidase LytH